MKQLPIVLALLIAPATAHAGLWYYKWSCSGECAPGRLAISGVSDGYATQDLCESARWGDPNREYFVASGNLGGLTSCEEYDSVPAPDGSSGHATGPIPTQRYSIGAIGGAGWRVRDANMLAEGDFTSGIDVNAVGGARPWIGVELGLGLVRSSITHPHYGPDPKPFVFVPLVFGLTSSPRIVEARKVAVRLDLGADLGFLIRTGCDECEADNMSSSGMLYVLRAGIDSYWGARKKVGVGLAAVFMLGKQGDLSDEFDPSTVEITPPKFLLRLALLGRNTNLWW